MKTHYEITDELIEEVHYTTVNFITTLEDGSTIETSFDIEGLAEEMLQHIHNKMVRKLSREGITE